METGRGWVFYDGTCGICGRWVPRWTPWLAARGLAVAPLQEAYLMRSSPWTRPVAWLVGLPPFRQLFDAAYRAFARHRYAVSRVCRLDPPTSR
jgi:predicted DCC family thiol-disulfide oxidoreductase YuxK